MFDTQSLREKIIDAVVHRATIVAAIFLMLFVVGLLLWRLLW